MDANTGFVTSCLYDDENNKMREYIYSVQVCRTEMFPLKTAWCLSVASALFRP